MIADLEAHLIELELRLQTSSTRSDAAAIAELLSEAFREFGASGRVWSRAEMIEHLLTETPQPLASESFECTLVSSGLALLTYVCSHPGRKTLRSSLWRFEGEQWRLLFHQGTIIPPA